MVCGAARDFTLTGLSPNLLAAVKALGHGGKKDVESPNLYVTCIEKRAMVVQWINNPAPILVIFGRSGSAWDRR